MKKYNYILKLIAVAMVSGLLLAGCGSNSSDTGSKADSAQSTGENKEAASLDVDALVKSLSSDISYEDELSDCSSDAGDYMTVEDGVDVVMYMTSGSYEEVAVFTAPDEATAAAMKADVQEFLNEQKSAAEDYEPEAAKRIDDAVLVVNGNYVVLCVSGDSDKAQEIIDKAFN